MSITPLTGDPSAIEVTFPTMPGQEEFRQLGYYLIDLILMGAIVGAWKKKPELHHT